MSKIDFAHIHCHTCYSIQDGMPQLKDYVNAIYNQNQNSSKYNVVGFALTDHGVLHGITDHYRACNEPDFPERKTKALYGIEIYHCEDVDNNPNNDRFHLVLIAKDNIGLHNIYQIASHAGTHLIHGRQKNFPTTDINFLKTHGTGIIASSACLGGKIPTLITEGNIPEAEKYALLFNDIFDEFYLEVQPLDIPEQLVVNNELVNMSKKLKIPLIITSDSHYINKSDSAYHNILKDIAHQIKFTEPAYLRTPEEMEDYCILHNIPLDCISNTGVLASHCNANPKPENNRYLLPVFPCPKGYTEETYLRKLSFEELKKKMIKNKIPNPTKYIKKMLYELEIICNAGYAGYFLILWDWFEWCRANDILCGPGRGSAAGSVVSYALNITKVDPIKNGFIFERFLNPGRLSFPDIDTDIPRSKRPLAISYLQQRYGFDNVSQIITFGKYKLKNVTKDVMSNLGCPFQEANAITKDIPDLLDGKEVTWDLIEGLATDPSNEKYSNFTEQEKKQIANIYDKYQDLFRKYPTVYDAIKSICGCIKSTGIHAGGVIICREPIKNHMGILSPTGSAVLPIIQIAMNDLEFYGFLKIDALGLSTLDVIKEAMDLAGLDYDWYDSEDYIDDGVYEMLRNGETTDVFQMAGYMATKLINDFKVDDIEGLTAVNAGNRPGPLEKDSKTGKSMTDLYTERRQSGVIPSIDPRIDPLLEKTFGCIWYQEDCMNLGKLMAGYDAGGADSRIRTVLGKKKIKMIPEIRNEFVYGKASKFNEKHEVIGMSEENSKWCVGAVNHGYTEELAKQIFESMEAFAKYSFNKSHAFCYAVLAYKTAWLSLHYPVEFAIANCTVNEEEEKIVATLSLAKKRKIPILGPDINKSGSGFTYEMNGVKESIRYGLKAIKGVGVKVIDFISKYKDTTKTYFTNFDDFYSKLHADNNIINSLINDIRIQTGKNSLNPMKKDVEVALILSGAFDYYEPNRYKLLNHYLIDIKKEKTVKLMGDAKAQSLPLKTTDYNRKTKLALEKYYMGSYISEHPLDGFAYEDFENVADNQMIKSTFLVSAASLKETKKKKKYLSIKCSDKNDSETTVNVFNEDLALNLKNDIKKNSIIIVEGNVNHRFCNINARTIKIAVKKVVDTEDMDIPEYSRQEKTTVSEEPEDILKTMFGM